ncbi:hypothetical protein [Variovorax sp. HW608]|uniref:hypothetical protein n=1 Tax=Variovorax sp. HW608 TaxID=1034889 RepID=UPI0012FE79F2|nr:hypothetical protein [Variovorax sp. HW608]
MDSSDVVIDESGREFAEASDVAVVPSDPESLADFARKIRLEEIAGRQRFRQHVAVAVIFAMAALTLVLIVQVGSSS